MVAVLRLAAEVARVWVGGRSPGPNSASWLVPPAVGGKRVEDDEAMMVVDVGRKGGEERSDIHTNILHTRHTHGTHSCQ